MKNFSRDIEAAIDNIIEGLEYPINIESIEAHKIKSLMKSKEDSFKYAKEMIHKWENSQNQPRPEKLKAYIERLVEAGDVALETLRTLFREKIDFNEVDEDRHHYITEGKSILHQAITNINYSLIELRNQLDADKFNLTDKEFKRGYPEKFANQELFPLKNYHKDWYDEETDSVMICPKGTKGKVITLDGLNVMLPKEPEDKSEILFSGLEENEQYWRRQEPPSGLNPESEEAFVDYIVEEFRRRREGLWFMNKGEAVYLTGSYYFILQHFKMLDDGNYMNFRYSQLNMNYHSEACVLDPRCVGELFVKSRRTGFTYDKIGRFLDEATSTSNATFGITSKSNEDASKAFDKLSYGFKNLPFYFQPVTSTSADNKKKIVFAKPADRSKAAKKKKDTNTDDYLNTIIDYQPTNEGSYDGQKMFRYLGDEASKWENGRSFEEHWGQISPTFDTGGKIVGKAFIGSTVAARNKGGQAFHELFLASDIEKRNKTTGRTPSGLYSYFLPAHKNMAEFTDKYGVCHEVVGDDYFTNTYGDVKRVGSVQYLEEMRKAKRKESEISYNNELRAFPMNSAEAFRDEANSCIFNIEKINEQLEYVESVSAFNKVMTGSFSWKDGIPDTKVVWNESPNGKFKVTWLPSEDMQNAYDTRMGFGGYSKAPLNEELGAFGCDSYDISGTVDNVTKFGYDKENTGGSKGALHGLTRFSIGDVPSNHFFLEYVSRASTADKFFEDVLMACVFYGMPILVENNKPRLLYHFKNRGYRNFSITRPDKEMNRLSKTEIEIGGVPNSSEDMKLMHSSAIESYIDKNVGYKSEADDYGNMFFEHTLRDWLGFDINKRTKFDASISSGLAIMAVNRDKYRPKRESKPVKINLYKRKKHR